MPIYEYRCQSCGHEVEILQKVSDPVVTECPECKAQALKKKVSAAGFRLKGGGWYETDFKSGNKKNVVGEKSGSEGGDKTAAKDGDKKSDGGSKTDTSSTSKTESKSSGGSTGAST